MVDNITNYGWNIVAVPLPDGNTEWWQITDRWRLIRTDPPIETITMDEELATALADKANINHSHPTLGNINFTGTISADGSVGLTGTRSVGGSTWTFKNGILTGFTTP